RALPRPGARERIGGADPPPAPRQLVEPALLCAADPADDGVVLDGHHQLVLGGDPAHELGVERLAEARVDDRRAGAEPLLDGGRRLAGDPRAVAVSDQPHTLALLPHPPPPHPDRPPPPPAPPGGRRGSRPVAAPRG